ncbi:MAG: radical SAM protein [Bacilli bacterium]|nr:radical SAM protein [Bacilli bacterium]
MYLELMKEKYEKIIKNYGNPFYVYISLTNICNANCVFCDVRLNKQKKNIIKVKELINELSALGTEYIHFTGGGEPFINEDIYEYLEYCTIKNIKIVLISNGLNLNEQKIKKLSKFNIVNFFFSIDSYNPIIHNELRKTSGLWETATANINLLKKYMPNLNIILNHVINKKNIDDFDKFIEMKQNVNFDYINPIIIKDYEELFPTTIQIDNFNKNENKFYSLAKKNNIKFLTNNIKLLNEKVDEKGSRNSNFNLKCVFPDFCAFIDCPTGDVFPCDCSVHRDKKLYKIGNLLENTFTEVWNGSKRQQLKHQLLKSKLDCKLKCDEANCLFNRKYFEK